MRTLLTFFAIALPTQIENDEAQVTILEDEIEIEYIDTTVWDQWVFETDSSVESMIFNDDGTITYIEQPQLQGQAMTFIQAMATWGWLYLGIPFMFITLFSIETKEN